MVIHAPKAKPVLELFSLKNRVCLVTGGSRGIGTAIVEAFLEAGANVAFTYNTAPDAEQLAERFAKQYNAKVIAYKLDVANPVDTNGVIQQIQSDFHTIDVCVANAGICRNGPTVDMTDSDFEDVFKVNVTGVFNVARAVGQIFAEQQKGSFITTTSMSGSIVNAPQMQAAYNASKAAAIHFTKSLALEWADFARCNCVSPGYTLTDMTLANRTHFDEWNARTPMKRLANVEELKGAFVFLAADASSYVTGLDLIVDGGYSIP